MYHPDGLKIEVTIKNVLDDKRLEIEPTDEIESSCELFIYGQIVNDFHTIDKNLYLYNFNSGFARGGQAITSKKKNLH